MSNFLINRILNNTDIASFSHYVKIKNLKRYPDILWDKPDAVLKWVSILKNIEELNIKNSTICDIGSGRGVLSSLLCESNDVVYAIDYDRVPTFAKNNLISIKKSFLECDIQLNSVDLCIDSCSITHFDTSFSDTIFNNGCYVSGQIIYNILKSNGYFITSTDFCEKNDYGEFININNLISIYEKCGLILIEKLSKNFINSFEIEYNHMILNIGTLIFQKK